MLKLLNRLAWFLSLVFGYLITLSFVGITWYGEIGDEEIGFSLFFGIFVGMIFKKIFLSKAFINSRLEYFFEGIGQRLGTEKIKSVEIKSDNIESEDIEEKEKIIEKADILDSKTIVFEENKIEKQQKEEIVEIEPIKKEPSKLAIAIKKFFSENLLAKLGGILVFLGVLFLLSLVYAGVGPVGKIIIGFAIGFGIYLTGIWLEKKEFKNEGRVLLGIGLLINYLVILSGRYLIGADNGNSFLSDTATFLFLIFNTVFAVFTSLVYKSRTLLLFSFLFAFINPFLVSGSLESPYLILGYSLIVSVGGLYLSIKQKDEALVFGVFILSNLLFLSAPFYSDIHWISKLISSTIMAVAGIFVMYNIKKELLLYLLIFAYLFIILLLGSGESYIGEVTSFISYMISIIIVFSLGIISFLRTGFNSLLSLLVFPVLIIMGVSVGGVVVSIPLSLLIIVFVYLIGFSFIESKMGDVLKYIFFSILGIYIFLTNSLISFDSVNLDFASFISVLFVSFVFLFTTYFLSQKKGLEYLFSIGTVGGVLMLAPVLQENSNLGVIHLYLSIVAVVIFAISKWIIPFIYKDFFVRKHNIKNIVVGVLIGLIFVSYELFVFGSNYFPGVALGFAFAALAFLYFFIAYMIVMKLGFDTVKTNGDSRNTVSVYIGAAISLFTLAMALVFSKYPGVISAVWLFEATILFFVYNRIKDTKIYVAAIILFMVGLSKLGLLIDIVKIRDYIFLVPMTLIAISFILNLRYLNFVKTGIVRIIHDILHLIGIIIIGILLLLIIPNTGHGWSIFGISIFISFIGVVYAYFDSKFLKYIFVLFLSGFALYQIGDFNYIIYRLERDSLEYLKILQYISTVIVAGGIILWNKINKTKVANVGINIVAGLYLLIITSIFVDDIFNSTFAVTIYWGILASFIFIRGISIDKPSFRTIGLYLIILTTIKIIGIDVWHGLDDSISRVIALIFVGLLCIFISTRFTKKFGNNLAGEFRLSNIVGEKEKIEEKEI